MESKQLNDIATTLDRIAKIAAGMLLRDIEAKDQIHKIARLKQCGFSNTEIARMLNTTTNTINVAVHSLKSKKGRKSRKRSKKFV